MNDIAFLKNIMRLRPMPVVMISTLTQAGAPVTLKALELSAVDFLAKPNPAAFSGSFAQCLDNHCVIKVVEAEQNMPIKAGHAYLTPGDDHLHI